MHDVEMCVQEVAEAETVSEVVASQHLRLLLEHGFLESISKSKWVFYSTAPANKTYSEFLLTPLTKELLVSKTKRTELIHHFTAFTHPRRIDIVKTLLTGNRQFEQLVCECDISAQALYRHLEKLITRNFIAKNNETIYRVIQHKNGLKGALITACAASPYSHTS